MHLKPPKRNPGPAWLRQPLGRFQSPAIVWPQAWAALLLMATGVAHVVHAGLHRLAHMPTVLVGVFGLSYCIIGWQLRWPNPRALRYGAIVTGLGLMLGTIGFITEFDRESGVNWFALATLLIDVMIVPLCLAGSVVRR